MCSASGFKTEVVHRVTIELQQQARLDFHLQVGERAEIVEVSAAGSLLRTEDATLGSVIESRRVVELPLNGRNFSQLATLMPGVIFGTSRIGVTQQGGVHPGPNRSDRGGGPAGYPATGYHRWRGDNRAAYQHHDLPAFDRGDRRVQGAERCVLTEYGVNSGAQINVAIKSGTNSLHGTLFEFVRNDKFDARGFFLPPTQTKNKLRPKPVWRCWLRPHQKGPDVLAGETSNPAASAALRQMRRRWRPRLCAAATSRSCCGPAIAGIRAAQLRS